MPQGTNTPDMDIKELEKKDADELARIGGDLDVADAGGMAREELVEQIMQRQSEQKGQRYAAGDRGGPRDALNEKGQPGDGRRVLRRPSGARQGASLRSAAGGHRLPPATRRSRPCCPARSRPGVTPAPHRATRPPVSRPAP